MDEVSESGIERGEPQAINLRVASLRRLNIDTPAKLRSAISRHFDRFRHFVAAVIAEGYDDADSSRWARGASLSFFCDYIAVSNSDASATHAYFMEELGNEEDASERTKELRAIVHSIRGMNRA